jgi:hypothetical protein
MAAKVTPRPDSTRLECRPSERRPSRARIAGQLKWPLESEFVTTLDVLASRLGESPHARSPPSNVGHEQCSQSAGCEFLAGPSRRVSAIKSAGHRPALEAIPDCGGQIKWRLARPLGGRRDRRDNRRKSHSAAEWAGVSGRRRSRRLISRRRPPRRRARSAVRAFVDAAEQHSWPAGPARASPSVGGRRPEAAPACVWPPADR